MGTSRFGGSPSPSSAICSRRPTTYDVYEVEPPEVERLQRAVEHRIDLVLYDYFVAAYQSGT